MVDQITILQKETDDERWLQSQILDNLAQGVYLIRVSDATIVYTNPKFEEMFGYEPDEMIGQPVHIVNAPTDKSPEETAQEIVEALRRNGSWQGQVQNVKKDGTPFWCQATVSTFEHSRYGRVWVSIHTDTFLDITPLKEVEDQLRHERDLLDRLLVTSPVCITLVNAQGQITYANPQAEKLFGLTKDEITQRSYNAPDWRITGLDGQPFPPEQLPFARVKASKQPVYNVQHAIEWPNRKRVLLSINAAPLLDKEGRFDGMVAAIEDITEQVQAQEKLKHYALELKQSNAELEQFAYVASHDLQEPLRMISSYLQLLRRRYRGKLDTDADEFIEFAVDGAGRMKRLIQDLLEYSRVGTRARTFVPVPAQAVLNRVLKNLEVIIKENEAVVTTASLPVVLGDVVQLEQLFQNLINNAIKFRGQELPEIHVGVEKQNGMWRFYVRDNGIGFAPEAANDIFTIFRRLHTRTEYGGTGLGLAICKKIVERHGGHIWAESEPGKGSTFFFTLPAAKEAVKERNS